ncbi:MAG: chromosomal replication initiator protein DnaA [Oscillospiraceae bacterium]
MESFGDVLSEVKQYCKGLDEISGTAFDLWISDIEPLGLSGDVARLYVKSDFKKKIVEEKYFDLLRRCFEAVMGFPVKIEIVCEEPGKEIIPKATGLFTSFTKEEMEAGSRGGEYEYTFATFIVGSSNKFAHAACHAVAQNPAEAYNPLFIYGGSGLGKTHLLYAISAEIRQNRPNFNIIYVKGEDFTNELIEAINTVSTGQFHDKYRQADVLLVDDIQFIGGKESTQEEFFHTFNSLYESSKQIVLTSDRPPKEIKTLEDRLRTRFEWGLIGDIQPPDFETRIAILQRKAQLLDISIPPEVLEYIANRIKNNIRQLEGVVKKLKAYKALANTEPSILVAQNAIRDILSDNQPIPVTIERIISEVSRTYGVTNADVRSNKRAAQISTARQVAMYIVREVTQMSMAAIGEEFGGRDHSTVVYSINQAEKTMENDSRYKETIEDIIKNIRDT